MDEAANRYAQELIDAMTAAVARDAEVQACRAKARAAGLDIKVTLEALIAAIDRPGRPARARAASVPPVPAGLPAGRLLPAARLYEITAADRRFLRSLRITADETTERVE
jgi:hypothetical protein